METVATFTPTAFDHSISTFLPDQADWIVLPVIQTRDSDPLEVSNYASAIALLKEAGIEHEEHRFGHWGPGWFELIIVPPTAQGFAETLSARLEDYPVLDEDDFCRREWEEAEETWSFYSTRDRIALCARFGVSIFAARRDSLPECDQVSELVSYLVTR